MLHQAAPPRTLHALHGAWRALSAAHRVQVGELGQLGKLRVAGLGVLRCCQQASLTQLLCQGSLQCRRQLVTNRATRTGAACSAVGVPWQGVWQEPRRQMPKGPLPQDRSVKTALGALDGDAPLDKGPTCFSGWWASSNRRKAMEWAVVSKPAGHQMHV